MRRLAFALLDLAGKFWTSPNTLLGFAIGFTGLPFGARIRCANNAIQFLNYRWGWGALALGNVVIYAGGTAPSDRCLLYDSTDRLSLCLHERAHTLQYQALGPLFLPAYFLAGGIRATNPFERAANEYARGGNWWPWQ